MRNAQTLYQELLQLDQQGYKSYQKIKGRVQFEGFVLLIDRVQADPFAAPSRFRIQVPAQTAGFPKALYQSRSRAIALRDYLNRQFADAASRLRHKRGSGKSGLIAIAQPTPQVLERSSVLLDDRWVEVRFGVGLPARGRTILGRQAAALLCEDLPTLVAEALLYNALDPESIQRHVETVEDADWLRQQLRQQGLVAFIPNGAILPRQSGATDVPLQTAVAFQSPRTLQVELDRPNQGKICGMGIPQGITLIVGGGYHGKSTLLQAIALGVYNHIPGDGREQVVTDPTAVKVRAEDGRRISNVDISAFIDHLPQRQSTVQFSTENASGSTSQAASTLEALEVGARLLLIDEDTSATNFMIRDQRMQALISKDREPITPFIDRVRQLYREQAVSTILVMGGSGDYFDVADTVVAMTEFQPEDVTRSAKMIAQQYPTHRSVQPKAQFAQTPRVLLPGRFDEGEPESEAASHSHQETHNYQETHSHQETLEALDYPRRMRVKVRGTDALILGDETIDLSAVEQLVEEGQLQAIGAAVLYLQQHGIDEQRSLAELVTELSTVIDRNGLDQLTATPQGNLAGFRSFELAAALNRWRSLAIQASSCPNPAC